MAGSERDKDGVADDRFQIQSFKKEDFDKPKYPVHWGPFDANPGYSDKNADGGGDLKDCVYHRNDTKESGRIECKNGKFQCDKDFSGKEDGKKKCFPGRTIII